MSKEEEITLLFFKQFLTNAENGSLLESPERQLSYCNVTMFNIYKWLTSSSSYYMEPILISLSFVKSTAKIIPRPFVNLCFNSLILPVLSTYQEMENVCFESVNNCIAEQNGFSISHVWSLCPDPDYIFSYFVLLFFSKHSSFLLYFFSYFPKHSPISTLIIFFVIKAKRGNGKK